MNDLKPCPFCGGKAGLEQISDAYWVECGKCVASSVFCGQPEPAIEAWNTRAERTCIAESHDCGDGVTGLYCSECGNYIDENDNYCPTCGARITEVSE